MSDDFGIQTFSTTEKLLSPFYYNTRLSKQSPLPEVIFPAARGTHARLSRGCDWGYTFCGPIIRCFSVPQPPQSLTTDRTYAPITIPATSYHFPNSIIKCAEELYVTVELGGKYLPNLIIGLDSGVAGGEIVIFDPTKGHPVRWIRTPAPVECMVVINHLLDKKLSSPFGSDNILKHIDGIVAVGLAGGGLILQDLGLDHLRLCLKNNAFDYSKPVEWENTFEIVSVNPVQEDVEHIRLEFLENHQLISVELQPDHCISNENTYDNQATFHYLGSRGEVLRRLRKSEVAITALHYAPAIGSILVGFNFGAFQVWQLQNLQLCYSVEFRTGLLPILAFEFQTPIDDPRNFCYIWVLSGNKSGELAPATVQLFALEYNYLIDMDNGNPPVYEELRSCARRLEFNLGDAYSEENHVPEKVRPIRLSAFQQMMFVSWESRNSAHLGLFDLDQWYSAQTPAIVPVQNPGRLCSFWAAISFLGPSRQQLFDLRLNRNSLQHWTNIHDFSPVQLYPASNTFEAIGLTPEGPFSFVYLGIQEMALRLVQKDGIHLMAQPSELMKVCTLVGLNQIPQSTLSENLPRKKSEQYCILSVLLEATRPAVIIQLANSWLDGSCENLGLNLHLIMEWSNHLAHRTRRLALPHWDRLLNPNPISSYIPPETNKFLHYSHFVWKQQRALLWTLLRAMEDALDCYYELNFGLEKLVQYSGAILIFNLARIVPVSKNEGDFTHRLKKYYAERRIQMQSALDNCKWIHPQERGGHALLVDYLFEHFEEETLRLDMSVVPGEAFYPPSHPVHMLNLLLETWIDVPSNIISRVIFYYMLDVLDSSDGRDAIGGDFEVMVDLSADEQNKVEILWMIDHGKLKDALIRLSTIRLDDEEEAFPWSAALVMLAAQGLQLPVLNILSSSPYPAKISRFALSLSLDQESHSLQLVRSRVLEFVNDQTTFFQLLQVADEYNKLDNMILSGIWRESDGVKCAVENYLQSLPNSFSNQVKLFKFFVHTGRIKEATAVYDALLKLYEDQNNCRRDRDFEFEQMEVALRRLLAANQGLGAITYADSTRKEYSDSPEKTSADYNRLDGVGMTEGVTPLSPLKRFQGKTKRSTSSVSSADEESNLISIGDGVSGNEICVDSNSRIEIDEETEPINSDTVQQPVPPPRSSIKRKKDAPASLRNKLLRTRFLEVVSSSETPAELNQSDSIYTICSDSSPTTSGSSPPTSGSGSTDPFSVPSSSSSPEVDDVICSNDDLPQQDVLSPRPDIQPQMIMLTEDVEMPEPLGNLEELNQEISELVESQETGNTIMSLEEGSPGTSELNNCQIHMSLEEGSPGISELNNCQIHEETGECETSLDSLTPSKRGRRVNSLQMDPNVSIGMMTRSRARHLSESSFLADNSKIFVDESPEPPPKRSKPSRARAVRAQSEPVGESSPSGVNVTTRRRRKSGTTSNTSRTTRSHSLMPSTPVGTTSSAHFVTRTSNRRGRKDIYTILESSIDESDTSLQDMSVDNESWDQSQVSIEVCETSASGGAETPTGKSKSKARTNSQKSTRRHSESGISSGQNELSIDEDSSQANQSSDTSHHNRRVFDYQPGLSTVLEVSETDSPIHTPMTRSRRRSLQQASMSLSSISEKSEDAAKTTELGTAISNVKKGSKR